MSDERSLLFQYCPKVAVFKDGAVLVARRQGEADLDKVFTLVGGKVEHSDPTIVAGIARELREEIGPDVAVDLLATYSVSAEFTKKDGSRMILPHYYADYVSGEIFLNEEYSEYAWVPAADLAGFENLISNVAPICAQLLRARAIADEGDFVNLGLATA